jgi:protein phosphatase
MTGIVSPSSLTDERLADDFTFECVTLSDVGRLRTNNEDSVHVVPEHGFVVLADGMGGYNAGEVASRMAVDNISAGLIGWLHEAATQLADPNGTPVTVATALQAMSICVSQANRAIFEDAKAHPDHAGMATTLVMALIYQQQLLIGHVGDSRAYRWRGGALQQLTRDHSILQEQVDAGLITLDQAAALRRHNLLTRGLGVETTVTLDVQATPLQAHDIYLLCSDGLTDMVSDPEIAAVLSSGLPLPDMTQVLVDHANASGGRDNITVALLRVIAS